VNRKFARVEQVKKFRLLEAAADAEDEELTPTMKLKRKLVQQKYAELIEACTSDLTDHPTEET
jgi:long-chain acyl-CoA synthetase